MLYYEDTKLRRLIRKSIRRLIRKLIRRLIRKLIKRLILITSLPYLLGEVNIIILDIT